MVSVLFKSPIMLKQFNAIITETAI
jgi:hypothetical protein